MAFLLPVGNASYQSRRNLSNLRVNRSRPTVSPVIAGVAFRSRGKPAVQVTIGDTLVNR